MKKKLLSALLAMSMLLSLTACGGNNTANDGGKTNTGTSDTGKTDGGKTDGGKKDEAPEEIPEEPLNPKLPQNPSRLALPS